MKSLHFIGCGNNKVQAVERFDLNNCTFTGKDASGTALEIANSNADITESSFSRCIFGTYKVSNGVSARVGGVIIADGSSIHIRDSRFDNNSAEVGGVIYSTAMSNITLIRCTFSGNSAKRNIFLAMVVL